MNRKRVRSTGRKRASLGEERGGESKGSYRDNDEAAAPALLVTDIKFSGVTVGSMIQLTVQVLPDLYLETITLIKGGPAVEIVGTLSPGSLKRLGSAKATISAELYDLLLSRAGVSQLLIALEHDQTRLTKIRFEHV